MDFNMKKLASGAGVFFTRAVQVGIRTSYVSIRQMKSFANAIKRKPFLEH